MTFVVERPGFLSQATTFEIYKHVKPIDFCQGHHCLITVRGEGAHFLKDYPSRQTLPFTRPDQKLVVDRLWDHCLPLDTCLIWKSVKYSLLKSMGQVEILLEARREGVDAVVMELRKDTKHQMFHATQDRSSHEMVALHDSEHLRTRILGNELYIALLNHGRIHVLYFDPDMETKPNHVLF
jgi:hypothetical protein